MSIEFVLFSTVVGAGALAAWTYVRLGSNRRPRSLGRACIHGALAVVALASMLAAMTMVGAADPAGRPSATLLGALVPTLTYVLLSSLFVSEQLQRRLFAR
jgi:hypothetical protein